MAAPTSTLPQPWSAFGPAAIVSPLPLSPPARSSAVLISSALVSAGDGDSGPGTTFCWYQARTSAAAPATSGAACDVPEDIE